MYTALSIAGSDSCGGAGIQADLKTMTAHGIYGMTAITALTAQNTTGVIDIYEVPPEFLAKQLDAVFTDIYPDAVKIGMLSGSDIMHVVTSKLTQYNAKNIVLDPVMVSTSGSCLMKNDSIDYMVENLFPLARVITPNIPEAEVLTAMKITCYDDMVKAGTILHEQIQSMKKGQNLPYYSYDTEVLIKGGHNTETATDVLINSIGVITYSGRRIDNPNTHGTGCTLSSAIACQLANGRMVKDAVVYAKQYINGALEANLNLGKGPGPLNHMWEQEEF